MASEFEMVVLHERPDLAGDVCGMLEEFLLLPDSWVRTRFPDGGLPEFLESELAALPTDPAPPTGEVVVALVDGAVAGTAQFRPMDSSLCELKRVYVRSQFRRQGIARCMVTRLMVDARTAGYERMYLDTSPGRSGSIRLYEDLGFTRTENRHDYGPGTVSMERDLRR